jgi:pyridoxamine 5'-phosphate oxidase
VSQLPTLPSPAPTDPLPLAARWLDEAVAGAVQPNPNAMTLATVAGNGQPSARVVLVKYFSVQGGYLVFYTHYDSRKGRELAANPHAAAVIHWDTLGRQLRMEGLVVRSPAAESDAYFAQRPPVSQFNAWASDQSQPITDRAALVAQASERAAKLGITVSDPDLFDATSATGLQRPEHWGGFRLWISALEFWVQGDGRFHDRIRYERELSMDPPTPSGGLWSAARLQP